MRHLFASLAVAVALAPAALAAQSFSGPATLMPASPAPVVASAPAAAPAAPSMVRPDVAGINVKADANAPLAVNTAAAAGLHQGEGVALMAVGGAGLVAGLLIGDSAGTAIAIGGLAVGLVGLYEYVR
ncbi:MAG TPA: hypothetical protein VN602_08060 [Gemmatimonadaceae bacterium]|nr:hypothetical protein [Gemmatimonadaceae bacterium]